MSKFSDAPKDKPTKINDFIVKQKNDIEKNESNINDNEVQISIYIPRELHKKLLILKATESIKIKDFVKEAIVDKLNK